MIYEILPCLIKNLNATRALSKRSVASTSNLSLAVISFTDGGLLQSTCSFSIKSYRFSFRPASIAYRNRTLQWYPSKLCVCYAFIYGRGICTCVVNHYLSHCLLSLPIQRESCRCLVKLGQTALVQRV